MKKLFKIPTNLVEYENWMLTASWQELTESLNQVCNAAIASCDRLLKAVKIRRRSCLRPMACTKTLPFNSRKLNLNEWRRYIHIEYRFTKYIIWVEEQIEMEDLLISAQEVLVTDSKNGKSL